METARYFFAVMLVIALPPAVIWWFVVHPFVGFWRRLGPAPTLSLLFVMMWATMYGLFRIRGRLVGTDLGTHWPLVLAAIAVTSVAFYIAMQRRKHLTMRILAGVPELESDGKGGDLLCEGIYAKIRHPRYVEVVLGTLGYALFANYVGAYVLVPLTVVGIHAVVLVEERELMDRFGDAYREYAARVPRYWPKRR